MSELLSDRAAVVTGGMSGIGRSIARRFAEHGADVVVADVRDRPRSDGAPTHELIERETDARSVSVECEVTEKADLEAAVAAADEFGGIDVMVNNAGIFSSEEFTAITEGEFDRVLDVNVKGSFFGTQVAAERMLAADGGSIVNMSSVAGLRGEGDFVTYCVSKGAVRLLTYAAADALGPDGIRVNAIHPGITDTKMMDDVFTQASEDGTGVLNGKPTGRPGRPEEVADAALYLASDLSSNVNAESLVVDGGTANT